MKKFFKKVKNFISEFVKKTKKAVKKARGAAETSGRTGFCLTKRGILYIMFNARNNRIKEK